MKNVNPAKAGSLLLTVVVSFLLSTCDPEVKGYATPYNMALIPSGCFDMGDHFGEGQASELPVHEVCITSDFYMDIYEVTNAEYRACEEDGGCDHPRKTNAWSRDNYYSDPTYDDYPFIFADWKDAKAYCAWAEKRLPTEAEWEYAARGGLSGQRYVNGDEISCADANYGRYDGSSSCYDYNGLDNDSHPGGSYAPNGYGLYDMNGNVWEFVNDCYQADYFSISPVNDPQGPSQSSCDTRILRGGAWCDTVNEYLRVSLRANVPEVSPESSYTIGRGMRCALEQ